jgi:hypothetical protein
MLWHTLVAFVLRLAFGLAGAMSLTSGRLVTSGYFRVHLWVVLGLNTFASVLLLLVPDSVPRSRWVAGFSILAGLLSYVGSVVWLYERPRAGRYFLLAVAGLNFFAAAMTGWPAGSSWSPGVWIDTLTSGMLLGSSVAAMLLGHWYLNTPTMKLQPLQRLIQLIVLSVLLRLVVAGAGFAMNRQTGIEWPAIYSMLLALRWLPGLIGVLAMAVMSWQTLKVPNTQSATGILYVAVIFSFLGELCSQLLSASLPYPL